MDWPSGAFLAPEDFVCTGPTENKNCTVLQINTNEPDNIQLGITQLDLKQDSDWDAWFENCAIFSKKNGDDAYVAPHELPRNGVCILFIPRAPDVSQAIESALTDLPLDKSKWDKVSKAFYLLPGHIVKTIQRKSTSITSILRPVPYDDGSKENLWTHIARTSTEGPDSFAFASTYIEQANLTLAMFIGCSSGQIQRVKKLLAGAGDATTHPLLMLGICAEMQLDRCQASVEESEDECHQTSRNLRDLGDTPDGEITWKLIDEVRKRRYKSKRTEEEVNATKRQLAKVLPPDFSSTLDPDNIPDPNHNRRISSGNSSGDNGNSPNSSGEDPGGTLGYTTTSSSSQYEPEKEQEINNMFKDRFADIFAQFDGLVARCRNSAGEMSFTVDLIRSELARREAQNTVKEAKMSTTIAWVAMLYLPMTTTATIFAMPIFQFPNKWRDERYNIVPKGNWSDPSFAASNGYDTDLPVFSGYFWIYFAISTFLTLATIGGWWWFTRTGNKDTKEKPGSGYGISQGLAAISKAFISKPPRLHVSKPPPHPTTIVPGQATSSTAVARQTTVTVHTSTAQNKDEKKPGTTESLQGDKSLTSMDRGTVEPVERRGRAMWTVLPRRKPRPDSPGRIA